MIADYVNYLVEEARSPVAVLHSFQVAYDDRADDVHVFFEGEDDPLLYMPEIRRYLKGREAFTYLCDGKKNAIEVREAIKRNGYSLRKCLFFIDRDFDDYTNEQAIIDEATYLTDAYSIENVFCSISSAIIVLQEVMLLDKSSAEYMWANDRVQHALGEFAVVARPIMAWVIAARAAGEKLNLNNSHGLRDIVAIVDLRPRRTRDGLRIFKRKIGITSQRPTFREVVALRRKLKIEEAHRWIRGKYALWFFSELFSALTARLTTTRRTKGIRVPKRWNSVRDGRFLELLGGRVPIPNCLDDFLRRRLAV